MTSDLPTVLTSWDAPCWAEWNSAEDLAVTHYRRIGTYGNPDGADVEVLLVQRDVISEGPTMTAAVRQPAYLLVSGEQIRLNEAENLARLLMTAANIATRPS